jgi:hypothetical protein
MLDRMVDFGLRSLINAESFILLPGDIYEKFARENVAMAKLTLSFIAPPDNERVTPRCWMVRG